MAFSPNGQNIAYVAMLKEKAIVVINNEEREKQEAIAQGSFIFSPDSQHLVYAAQYDGQKSVVIDGEKGKNYDDIILKYGGKLIFDTPEKLRYLAVDGNKIYIVEEIISPLSK